MAQIRRIKTPQNGLLHTEDKVELEVNGTSIGAGTLFVCRDSLSWRPSKRSEGVVIPWKQINFLYLKYEPSRFVVMELSDSFVWEGVYEKAQREQGDNVQLFLIPSDMDPFDPIFEAMLKCYCNTMIPETQSDSKATPTADDDVSTTSADESGAKTTAVEGDGGWACWDICYFACCFCWYLPYCPFRHT